MNATLLLILALSTILAAVGAAVLGSRNNLPVRVILTGWLVGTIVLALALILIIFVIIPLVLLVVAIVLVLVVIAVLFALGAYVWYKLKGKSR